MARASSPSFSRHGQDAHATHLRLGVLARKEPAECFSRSRSWGFRLRSGKCFQHTSRSPFHLPFSLYVIFSPPSTTSPPQFPLVPGPFFTFPTQSLSRSPQGDYIAYHHAQKAQKGPVSRHALFLHKAASRGGDGLMLLPKIRSILLSCRQKEDSLCSIPPKALPR